MGDYDKIIIVFSNGRRKLVIGFKIEHGMRGYIVEKEPKWADMKYMYFETIPLGMMKKCKDNIIIKVFGPRRAVVKLPYVETVVDSAVVPGGKIVKVDPPAKLVLHGLTLTYDNGSVSVSVERYELMWKGRKYKHENIGPSGIVCTGEYKPKIPVDPSSEEFCYYAIKTLHDVVNILSTPNALSAYQRSFTVAISQSRGDRDD